MNNNKTPHILLLGATGKAGSVILSTLLVTDHKVQVIVRTPEKLQIKEHKNLKITVGDVTTPGVFASLTDECSVIINATSSTTNPAPIHSIVTESILSLIKGNPQLSYFVLTGKTVKSRSDTFSFRTVFQRLFLRALFPAIVKDKQREYELLLNSSGNWTLVRVPLIVDGDTEQVEASLSRCKGKSVTKRGIAKFIINEITGNRFTRKSPFIYSLH